MTTLTPSIKIEFSFAVIVNKIVQSLNPDALPFCELYAFKYYRSKLKYKNANLLSIS